MILLLSMYAIVCAEEFVTFLSRQEDDTRNFDCYPSRYPSDKRPSLLAGGKAHSLVVTQAVTFLLLSCQTPGSIGSMLRPAGEVLLYYDCVRQQVCSYLGSKLICIKPRSGFP